MSAKDIQWEPRYPLILLPDHERHRYLGSDPEGIHQAVADLPSARPRLPKLRVKCRRAAVQRLLKEQEPQQ